MEVQDQVKIINKSTNLLPKYATIGSSGLDLMATVPEGIKSNFLFNASLDFWDGGEKDIEEGCWILTINPGGRALIPTGIYLQMPEHLEAQIRPRSGLALKKGVTVLNSPATIDSDYTGELGIVLVNFGTEPFKVRNGDRIAQLVFMRIEKPELVSVTILEKTERGDGGFGHTGIKNHD